MDGSQKHRNFYGPEGMQWLTSNFAIPPSRKLFRTSSFPFPSFHTLSPPAFISCSFTLSFCLFLYHLRSLQYKQDLSMHYMRSGGALELPDRGPGRSPGRKRILEHFAAPETTSGDIKFSVFAVWKNKHHNFGPTKLSSIAGSAGSVVTPLLEEIWTSAENCVLVLAVYRHRNSKL